MEWLRCRTVKPGFGGDRGVRLVWGSSLTERSRMRSSLSFAEKSWVSVKLPIIPGKDSGKCERGELESPGKGFLTTHYPRLDLKENAWRLPFDNCRGCMYPNTTNAHSNHVSVRAAVE